MDRPFERIELGGDDDHRQWWEIYTLVTRGMRRQFRKAAMSAITGKMDVPAGTDLADPEQLKAALLNNASLFDLNAVDDGYLLHGTKAWSWPEPVSREAIDALPDALVEKVLERMRALYAEPGEEAQKKDIGRY